MSRTSVGTLVAELDLDTTRFHRAVTNIRSDAANLGGDPTGLTAAFAAVSESVANAASSMQEATRVLDGSGWCVRVRGR